MCLCALSLSAKIIDMKRCKKLCMNVYSTILPVISFDNNINKEGVGVSLKLKFTFEKLSDIILGIALARLILSYESEYRTPGYDKIQIKVAAKELITIVPKLCFKHCNQNEFLIVFSICFNKNFI